MPNIFGQIESGTVPPVPTRNPVRSSDGGANPFLALEEEDVTASVSPRNDGAEGVVRAERMQPKSRKNPFEAMESSNASPQEAPQKVPRVPWYGADGKPVSDAEYAEIFDNRGGKPRPRQQPTAMGRITGEALRMGREALAFDTPLGPSRKTYMDIGKAAGYGVANDMNMLLTAGDAVVRGIAAPIHAFAGAAGQTANELGLAPGSDVAARDIAGMFDVAAFMTPWGAARAPHPRRTPRAVGKPQEAPPVLALPKPSNTPKPQSPTLETPLSAQTRVPEGLGQAPTGGSLPNNINLTRIQAPEDVKGVIQDVAARSGGFAEARRGRVTFEDIEELAPMVGMTPEKLASRGVGKTLGSAEEMYAARQVLVTQAEEVRKLARAAEGGSDADKLKLLEGITRMVAIQESVAGATAEAGRMLSQFRMMAKGDADEIRRVLDSSGGQVDDIISGINAFDDASPEVIASFVKNAAAARSSDMVLEAWINALLSGPTTHATNMLSNALVATWAVPETLATAAVSKATGSGVHFREAFAKTFGILEGAKDGIRAGWRAFLTEEPSNLTAKIEARRYKAIPSVRFRAGKGRKEVGGVPVPLTGEIQVGGRQARIPGRLLMAEDEFFKSIGYRQEINALAVRQALNSGLKGKALAKRIATLRANPTDEMKRAAHSAAERQTFTNPLGVDGRALQAWANRHPPARVIVPFIRTPVNIVKFAAHRSPAAPLFKEVRENLSGANGAVARDEQIARIALGSTVSAVAAYMAVDGTITGGGPVDQKKRSLKYATGWQPYSVKIGDTYYSYSRMEPLGTLLGVAADFTELNAVMTEDEQASVAALIMGSVSKNLVSKTWLRGPAELIEAVQDPDRYGGRYVQNLVGTVVPTGVAQVARHQDPYLREARTILEKIKSRIPGQREKLPVRRDIFGDPIKLEGALGPDLLSPIYQSKATNDPVAAELLRLGLAPSRLGRKIRGVDLGAGEYEAYQVNTGHAAKMALAKLITSPEWNELPDDVKADLVGDVMRKSRDLGRAKTMIQNPDLLLRIADEKKSEVRARP